MWKHTPTLQETAGLVISPGFTQKSVSDPSDLTPTCSKGQSSISPGMLCRTQGGAQGSGDFTGTRMNSQKPHTARLQMKHSLMVML